MDPRQLRTRRALTEAIIELASSRPTDSLSVSEVAERAGISRDTFYRHASSPSELLRSALEEDLAALEMPTEGGEQAFGQAERQLLQHVADHATIYRNALVHGSERHVRDMLVSYISGALERYVDEHPEILPEGIRALEQPHTRNVAIAYAASGTVGAIESWLRDAETEQLDVAATAEAIVAASPSWWVQLLRS
jgi:AcrR family transcriptional regulator